MLKKKIHLYPPAAKALDKDEAYYANQMSPRADGSTCQRKNHFSNGDPLIGVNLLVQGTNLGTTSQWMENLNCTCRTEILL
jgi:hypothetical protein